MPQEFVTPVGRLVQGSVFDANTTDNKGQPLIVKTGPNKGQPTQNHFMAVAFPKTQAAWFLEPDPFWMMIYNEGRQGYPQHFNPQTGACNHPRFAFKVMDGDGVDNDGKPNNTKEGFAGHWIVKFSTTICPKGVFNGKYLNPQDAAEKNAIKRGHFVRVMGSMRPNIGSEVPGIYLNQSGVEWIAYGPEIISGPDALAAFAAAPKPQQLPPGATMTPPAGAAMPAMGAVPGGVPPGVAPQAVPMQPAAVPGGPVAVPMQPGMPAPGTPNHAFVQNAIGVPGAPGAVPPMPSAAPAMPPAAPAAPQFQMTAKAGGFTREQYNAQGWTDDKLVADGIMVRVA